MMYTHGFCKQHLTAGLQDNFQILITLQLTISIQDLKSGKIQTERLMSLLGELEQVEVVMALENFLKKKIRM